FLNDGYHVEHHMKPQVHWTRLPQVVVEKVDRSRWPAILRWIECVNLELLERLVLRSALLQKFLLITHEQALRKVLPKLPPVRTIVIVGGGMFPRTAILLHRLLPEAKITIVDRNFQSIQSAKPFLNDRTTLLHEFFDPTISIDADLLVIPLSFIGDRNSLC